MSDDTVPVGPNGLVALVDEADYALVSGYRWHAVRSRHTVYAVRTWREAGRRRWQFMHGLIMGTRGIDHADRDGLNNRRSNLRLANQSQNMANQGKQAATTSRFKGVYWDRGRSKWHVQIKTNGHRQYLGLFAVEEEAARAYDVAAKTAWGEFARTNFPREKP